jgi:alpha-mannosidase
MHTGWLVDTFGHISQSPQIHRLFGIDAVFVWRGVPRLEPYFHWQGADGSQLLTINLFGGYRNLYGVTRAPEVAVRRLLEEVAKLQPFYPTPDIPLFDGYDLEGDPEDPMRFYAGLKDISPNLALHESTPALFAQEIAAKQLALPTLAGELNSGKYGATFPGTFSARAYLKVMARDCETMLFQQVEPLATLAWLKGRPYAAAQYAAWGRALLQNAVHDCICGVSIDEVHEKMEVSYRRVFDAMQADIQASLPAVLSGFAPGLYAVSTVPFALDRWLAVDGSLVHVQTDGIGVWPVLEQTPIVRQPEAVTSFAWRNDYYAATVDGAGLVQVDGMTLGELIVAAEHGDTYSEERGETLGTLQPVGPLTVEERSDHHAILRFSTLWQDDARAVNATVRVIFDPSPLIRWQIDLDSRGADLRVEMHFATGKQGQILAAMPFDVVTRPLVDTDLLPRESPAELKNILLGQRELNAVSAFPLQDYVALGDESATVAVFAKGIRSYAADDSGAISLLLQRSVEWLTRADLRKRVGDAGPFFYVPDARGERIVRHEVGVACVRDAGDSMALQRLNATFQLPPLLVRTAGSGGATSWRLLQEDAPLSSLQVVDGSVLARFANPTRQAQPLSAPYQQTDVWGAPGNAVSALAPKAIVTLRMHAPASPPPASPAPVELLTPLAWRVGPNAGRPDPAVVATLEAKSALLAAQAAKVAAEVEHASGSARLRLQHRTYVLQRESMESRLSWLLNQRKLETDGSLREAALYQLDEEIAEIGLALNQLRIKRRIFDYVVAAL